MLFPSPEIPDTECCCGKIASEGDFPLKLVQPIVGVRNGRNPCLSHGTGHNRNRKTGVEHAAAFHMARRIPRPDLERGHSPFAPPRLQSVALSRTGRAPPPQGCPLPQKNGAARRLPAARGVLGHARRASARGGELSRERGPLPAHHSGLAGAGRAVLRPAQRGLPARDLRVGRLSGHLPDAPRRGGLSGIRLRRRDRGDPDRQRGGGDPIRTGRVAGERRLFPRRPRARRADRPAPRSRGKGAGRGRLGRDPDLPQRGGQHVQGQGAPDGLRRGRRRAGGPSEYPGQRRRCGPRTTASTAFHSGRGWNDCMPAMPGKWTD